MEKQMLFQDIEHSIRRISQPIFWNRSE